MRAVALEQVRRVAAAVSIPVIGMGGIERAPTRSTFIAAGATAVAVGTASFRDPLAATGPRELAAELAARGLGRIRERRR